MVETRVLKTGEGSALAEAVTAIKRGELVAFPTDTVYGVGCDPWQPGAVEALYEAKQRPRHMAIPVLLSAPDVALAVTRCLPDGYRALAERFWPGGLTIIVPRRGEVPSILCAEGDTIAVRLPDHPVPRALAEAIGGCLAATSANRSGEVAAVDASRALAALEGRISVLLDGGLCREGIASTIVDLVADPPRVLRQGGVALADLLACVPGLVPPSA